MKSKIRSITVRNIQYRWRVVRANENQTQLRVWRSGEQKQVWLEVLIDSPDMWLLLGASRAKDLIPVTMTPKIVRAIIERRVGSRDDGAPGSS